MTEHPQNPDNVIPFTRNDDEQQTFWDRAFYQWDLLDPAKLEPRRWIYGGHYLEGAVTATIADGGVGKSTLALTEAIAIVTGRPLLGITPTKQTYEDGWTTERRTVLYYNAEESLDEIKRRVLAICQHFGVDPKEVDWRNHRGLWIASGHDFPLVLAKSGGDGFAFTDHFEYIEQCDTDVVILDPFVSMHQCPENDNTMIDAIVKRLARATTISYRKNIELVHHARKPAQGGSMEIGTADARGASALGDGVRSLRTLNRMTESQAAQAKVDNHRSYFRVDFGKPNYTAPSSDSRWYRHQSVILPNGDDVGIIVPWRMPGAFDGVTPAHMHQVRTMAGNGSWRADSQSPEWIGGAVAVVLNLDPESDPDRRRVKTILKEWYAKGVLQKVERQDCNRETRLFVEPGKWTEE